jgi:hypothetical protein
MFFQRVGEREGAREKNKTKIQRGERQGKINKFLSAILSLFSFLRFPRALGLSLFFDMQRPSWSYGGERGDGSANPSMQQQQQQQQQKWW